MSALHTRGRSRGQVNAQAGVWLPGAARPRTRCGETRREDRSPRFCGIYDNPGTTRFTFGRDPLERLSRLPTIRAVKTPLPSDGDYREEIAALRHRTGLANGYSGDWGTAEALLAGADAFYSVLGGTLPHPVMALVRAAYAGDAQQAGRIDASLAPLWETFKAFGSLRVMYVLLDLRGLGKAELPKPILPLAGEAREQVLTAAETLLDVR